MKGERKAGVRAELIAAEAALARGETRAAAEGFERAERLSGGAACAFNAAQAWRAAGDTTRALDAWRRAASDPSSLGTRAHLLGRRLGEAGDVELAARVLRRLVDRDPFDFDAHQALVDLAAADRAAAAPPRAVAMPKHSPATISFVVCSIDAAKFASVSATIALRFAGIEHEVIRIGDARSLCEGYARGFAQARGDAIVFCHDDIDLLAPDAAARLAVHLERFDLVGVAGTTRVTGPAVFWSGHPHIHGWVTHRLPGETDYEPSFSSFAGANAAVGGIEAIDGVLMACRRETVREIGFDAATFDGFHLYDLDFSYRAHRAGRRLGVACDLGVVHASKGRFDDAWARYAERFRAKYPALTGERGAPHFYAARVPDAAAVLALQRRLAELTAEPT
jgi:tetratricopeptide (TPR) repeat protein